MVSSVVYHLQYSCGLMWSNGNFNYFFDLFLIQHRMSVQHKTLMTLKDKKWVDKFEFIILFSLIHTESKVCIQARIYTVHKLT